MQRRSPVLVLGCYLFCLCSISPESSISIACSHVRDSSWSHAVLRLRGGTDGTRILDSVSPSKEAAVKTHSEASMRTQKTVRIPRVFLRQMRTLLRKNPDGILLSQLPQEYEQMHNDSLEQKTHDLGFKQVQSLLAAIPAVVECKVDSDGRLRAFTPESATRPATEHKKLNSNKDLTDGDQPTLARDEGSLVLGKRRVEDAVPVSAERKRQATLSGEHTATAENHAADAGVSFTLQARGMERPRLPLAGAAQLSVRGGGGALAGPDSSNSSETQPEQAGRDSTGPSADLGGADPQPTRRSRNRGKAASSASRGVGKLQDAAEKGAGPKGQAVPAAVPASGFQDVLEGLLEVRECQFGPGQSGSGSPPKAAAGARGSGRRGGAETRGKGASGSGREEGAGRVRLAVPRPALAVAWAQCLAIALRSKALVPLRPEESRRVLADPSLPIGRMLRWAAGARRAERTDAPRAVEGAERGREDEGAGVELYWMTVGGFERVWPSVLSVVLPLLTKGEGGRRVPAKEGVTALWAYLRRMFGREGAAGDGGQGAEAGAGGAGKGGDVDGGGGSGEGVEVGGDFFVVEVEGRRETLVASRLAVLPLAKGEEGEGGEHKDEEVLRAVAEAVEALGGCPEWWLRVLHCARAVAELKRSPEGGARTMGAVMDEVLGREPVDAAAAADEERGGVKALPAESNEAHPAVLRARQAAATPGALPGSVAAGLGSSAGQGEAAEGGRGPRGNFGGLPSTDKQIVIDGCNVAWNFASSVKFSTEGLEIALKWFIEKGYDKTVAFVPHTYANPKPPPSGPRANVADDRPRLRALHEQGLVLYTPPGADDDAFIIQFAFDNGGYIVSNDNYREFKRAAQEAWQGDWLLTHKIFYTFVGKTFLPTAPKVLRKPPPSLLPTPGVPELGAPDQAVEGASQAASRALQGEAHGRDGVADAAAPGARVGTVEQYIEQLEHLTLVEDQMGLGPQLGEGGGWGGGPGSAGDGWGHVMDQRMSGMESLLQVGLAGVQAEQRAQREVLEKIHEVLAGRKSQEE